MSRYEIQQFTVCDGWVNTWLSWDEQGNVIPETFDTFSDASMALDEFLSDQDYEYQQGNIISPYSKDEYQIVEVSA